MRRWGLRLQRIEARPVLVRRRLLASIGGAAPRHSARHQWSPRSGAMPLPGWPRTNGGATGVTDYRPLRLLVGGVLGVAPRIRSIWSAVMRCNLASCSSISASMV